MDDIKLHSVLDPQCPQNYRVRKLIGWQMRKCLILEPGTYHSINLSLTITPPCEPTRHFPGSPYWIFLFFQVSLSFLFSCICTIQPDSVRTQRFLTVYFSKSIWDGNVKCWQNLYLCLQFLLLKCRINIFHSLESMRFSAT